MMELVEANWVLFLIALVIGIIVAWWIFAATRRTSVKGESRDVLDEGAQRAARNQTLIDSPAAEPSMAPQAAVVPPGLAGAGTAVAAVVEEKQREAREGTKAQDETDDLTRIKGVGPKLRDLLIGMDVKRFEQIADWSEDDIDRIDAQLGRFEGRIRRDNWPEQARLLAAGDTPGYEAQFGKL